MNDKEHDLEPMRKLYALVAEVYKQNQQILTRIEAIEKSVGTVEHTHRKPLKGKDKPWEAWTKKQEDEADMVKETFKL